ncbi:MAG: precorrin-8X methylmutase [Lachnospiraceae bacterium]|nr:precorrin-8X methylmutase [Lachnospiraceae bacterium]
MENKLEYVLPYDIEKRSFEIIGEELKEKGIVIPKEQEFITKRVIHTSADFEYADTMTYSEGVIEIAKNLIKNGADIVTDTNMALSGINKKTLVKYGGEVHCFMADEDVAKEAKERQVTRATVSMEKASKIKKPVIFAVGNAPTALIKLYEMIKNNEFTPALIIGVPVGFVNVEAAKELILSTDVPYIVNRGRKGGSNIAAAICNAILYNID